MRLLTHNFLTSNVRGWVVEVDDEALGWIGFVAVSLVTLLYFWNSCDSLLSLLPIAYNLYGQDYEGVSTHHWQWRLLADRRESCGSQFGKL